MTEPKKIHCSPCLIGVCIGGFIAFLVWAAFQASILGSKVTDRDYYSKGLKYNATQVEKRAAEVLGWNLETRLSGRTLEFRLVDSKSSPVIQAAGSLYLAIPGVAENVRLPLREAGSGLYRVELAASFSGAIQARLEMERQGARINRQLLLNL